MLTVRGHQYFVPSLGFGIRYGVPHIRVLPHDHDFYELVIPMVGHAQHLLGGRQFRFAVGDIALVAPGQVHAYERVAGLVQIIVMIDSDVPWLNAIQAEPQWCALVAGACLHLDIVAVIAVRLHADACMQAIHHGGANGLHQATEQVQAILHTVVPHCRAATRMIKDPIDRIADVLTQRCAEIWTLAELAARAGCSPRTLTRQFTKRFTMTPQA